jgi:hypothetical protein
VCQLMKNVHWEISIFVLYKYLVRFHCRRKVFWDVIENFECLGQLAASIFRTGDLKLQAGDSFMILVDFLPKYMTLYLRNIFLQTHFILQ